jgi:predicted protein tyrosine phosphatase
MWLDTLAESKYWDENKTFRGVLHVAPLIAVCATIHKSDSASVISILKVPAKRYHCFKIYILPCDVLAERDSYSE